MEQKQDKNEVEIFSSLNEYEINQVCSILGDNNIPFIRKDYGSGSYMNIYFGQSIQDKKVFVNEDCYDKALELISTIFSNASSNEQILSRLLFGVDYSTYFMNYYQGMSGFIGLISGAKMPYGWLFTISKYIIVFGCVILLFFTIKN